MGKGEITETLLGSDQRGQSTRWSRMSAGGSGLPERQGTVMSEGMPGRQASFVPSGLRDQGLRLFTKGTGQEVTVTCQICFCSYRKEQILDCPARKEGCGPWCRECVAEHIKVKVRDGHVAQADLCCPGSGCDETLLRSNTEEELAELLAPLGKAQTADILAKRARYAQTQKENTRECPKCGTLQEGKHEPCSMGDYAPELTCTSCGEEFCFYHANAHPGRNCKEFLQEPAQKALAEVEDQMKKRQKPCPVCGKQWQKTRTSCNHMTCPPPCKTHWCWICGQKINPGTHYADFLGIRGRCAGRMFEGMAVDEQGIDDGDMAEVLDAEGPSRNMCDNPCTTPPQYRWSRILSYILVLATFPYLGTTLVIFLGTPALAMALYNCVFKDDAHPCLIVMICPLLLILLFLSVLFIFLFIILWMVPLMTISMVWGILQLILIGFSQPLYCICTAAGRPTSEFDAAQDATMVFPQQYMLLLMMFLTCIGADIEDEEGVEEPDPENGLLDVQQGERHEPFPVEAAAADPATPESAPAARASAKSTTSSPVAAAAEPEP
eukprot:Hpha_TRINITY_DN11374_c0_g1::TRINITY_DN11374_c0_g1_i2::g.63129::m.63129/K11971/RNF14, ARA54; E3 ubiquitin-protein ligase RNF14